MKCPLQCVNLWSVSWCVSCKTIWVWNTATWNELTTKCRLHSSCIFAVLLYASETWTLTKADWKRLESFHLRWLRRILGIKWSDFITDAEVCTRSGLQSIQSIVRRRRLSLFGHVARMPDNVPAKAVLHVACNIRHGVPPYPNWRRSRGRPPITWLHQICSDCGPSAGDTLNCAQDRAVWRTYAMASSASRWRRWRRHCNKWWRGCFECLIFQNMYSVVSCCNIMLCQSE